MELENKWVEYIAGFFALVGLVLALALQNPLFNVVVVILSGFIAGRVFYMKFRVSPLSQFGSIIFGFFLGFFLGNFWVSRIAFMILFGLSMWGTYRLYKEKIITIFKSDDYVK